MNQAKNNPISNNINSGLNDSEIDNAILKSGYPLQTIIADKLRKEFYTQEEWSFIDSKTKEIRAIDIHAEKHLYELTNKSQPRVRPSLNLVIECKQSEMPYVFFLSPQPIQTTNYPLFSGLFHKDISINTDDDNSTWNVPLISCLGHTQHDFLFNTSPSCMTFSRCVRNGKDIALSGKDAYQHLVMPLVKSLQHLDNVEQPPKTAIFFDCHITVGIGVVDAPMIGVKVSGDKHETELLPWVRVSRHESYENDDWTERQKVFSIDIVHKDFFEIYLNNNLLPFARSLSEKILKHQAIVAEGKGFVKGMGKDSWHNIEDRLEIRGFGKARIMPKLK
jgi:hypothetical protein